MAVDEKVTAVLESFTQEEMVEVERSGQQERYVQQSLGQVVVGKIVMGVQDPMEMVVKDPGLQHIGMNMEVPKVQIQKEIFKGPKVTPAFVFSVVQHQAQVKKPVVQEHIGHVTKIIMQQAFAQLLILKVVEVLRIQFVVVIVDVQFQKQRQVSTVQTVQEREEVPVRLQVLVPMITKVQMPVDGPQFEFEYDYHHTHVPAQRSTRPR